MISVYKYCRDVLGYSEDAAWNRAAAANVVRRFPIVLTWLADGSLNITTVRILRGVLTAENHLAVLNRARGRGKKEVELIEARLNPKSDVAPSIRRVTVVVPAVATPPPVAEIPRDTGDDRSTSSAREADATPVAEGRSLGAAAPSSAPATVVVERYRVQITISKETHDKLRRLQDLLCREIPDGDPALVFDRALDVLLQDVEKKKLAATSRPRSPRRCRDGSRDIPAHVVRAVWKRDGGQCAFVGRTGRCTERRFLERHHVQPFGYQGPPTLENISLRCRAHNVYESEQVFGRFDPSVIREPGETYAVSREIAPFRNGVRGNEPHPGTGRSAAKGHAGVRVSLTP